jgi:hypothetical protein
MSLDIESELRRFLASAPQSKHAIQVISISHSAMSQEYNLWTEPYAGEVTTEDDIVIEPQPTNIAIKLAGTPAHLDQAFDISISTVASPSVFRAEMDRIPLDTTERIVVVYREYLSDNLEEPQAVATLQVESIGYTRGAAVITAASPRLNVTRTGELYTLKRFPMLRGFI